MPWVCSVVPIILGLIWYLSNNEMIDWFGSYQFGAELIVYNALISYGALWLISYKAKD